MDETIKYVKQKDSGYMLFVGSDEKIIYEAKGVLDNVVEGILVLTDKKLFFYFVSNISRDKFFIATHPYIKSVEIKEGLLNSALTVKNKSRSFKIKKINKKLEKEFDKILNSIIQDN